MIHLIVFSSLLDSIFEVKLWIMHESAFVNNRICFKFQSSSYRWIMHFFILKCKYLNFCKTYFAISTVLLYVIWPLGFNFKYKYFINYLVLKLAKMLNGTDKRIIPLCQWSISGIQPTRKNGFEICIAVCVIYLYLSSGRIFMTQQFLHLTCTVHYMLNKSMVESLWP